MNAVSWTKRHGLGALIAACGLAVGATDAPAQIGWTPAGEVCTSERTVSGVVIEKKTCVRWKPVTKVCMKPQKSVTYRNVCRVGFRNVNFLQLVPRTTYHKVTVDKGCWKMVWCPNLVTKMVPRTTMERVTRTRKVPYQYTEQVPQVVTRMVPHRVTKYVPQTYQTVERVPFHHRLPSQRTVSRPPSCSAPAPPPMTYSPPPAPVMPRTTYTPPPAPPNCAVPQQTSFRPAPARPTCAIPSVYPPAVSPTYDSAHLGHGHDYQPGAAVFEPAPVPTEAAPLPGGQSQSYYPTQSAPTVANWNSTPAAAITDTADDGPIKSLAALWD